MGLEDGLDKAELSIEGAEGEFTVAGVNGTPKDEVDVEESKEGTTLIPCAIHSCSGLTDEHAPQKYPSFWFASAV